MTQEYIMKKKMQRAIAFSIIMFIILLVFVSLFVASSRQVQKSYREQFNDSLGKTVSSVESYLNAEGDFELRYHLILSNMSSANSFAFLLENLTEQQKIAVNELQTVILKYPQQMQEREKLEELLQILKDIQANLDKGFDEAEALVSAIDKKGY